MQDAVQVFHALVFPFALVTGAILLAIGRTLLGRALRHARPSEFVNQSPSTEASTPEQRFGLMLGAVYVEFDHSALRLPASRVGQVDLFACLNLGEPMSSSRQMLQSWWNIVDPITASQRLAALIDGGLRTDYVARLAWLQVRHLLEASFGQVAAAVQAQPVSDGVDWNPEAALEAMLWVRGNWRRVSRGGVAGFAIARLIYVVRASFAASYLSEEEAWQAVQKAVPLALAAYDSWEEFGAGFLVGRESWSGAPSLEMEQIVDRLLRVESSPWRRLMWPLRNPAVPLGELLH